MYQKEHEEQIVSDILSYYPFQIEHVALKSNKSGRKIWEIQTDQGAKLLKEAQMKPERMLFITQAHAHLQEKGLPVAPIHQTKNGGSCLGTDQVSYSLYDEVTGKEMIYYDAEQMKKVMSFAGHFHHASKGYVCTDESKKRSRLGKWHKLYRWKLQELEGNMQIAASYPDDLFSQTFLKHADKMLARGKEALQALDESEYENWTKETHEHGGFCFQDFTLARLTEIDGEPFLKELHSITYDLPSRDLRILLNKVMVKLSVWDIDFMVALLAAYDAVYPLTEKQYEVLWIDLAFPHLFCAIGHKYYLKQKKTWSDEKYNWALQNMISVEESKDAFLDKLPELYKKIKAYREAN
ncbi:spore coat protein [Bacillus subtilis]|nr:spore coat protein [Bacillus subtilis]